MTSSRLPLRAAVVLALAAVGAVLVASAHGAGAPPPPTVAGGATATVVATGVPTPTEFAFVDGTIWVAAAGGEPPKGPPGGVFRVDTGRAVRVPGTTGFVSGIAYHVGTLYVASGGRILALSGWDGTRFKRSRTVVSLPPPFTGFSGLAVSPKTGDIYTGVQLGQQRQLDYTAGTSPYANDVLRINPRTGEISVVARGLRQPWQLAFVHGSASPFVSDLGQENLGKRQPPDYVVRATPGANFGFSACNWSSAAACAGYARPAAFFPAHASPMGIGVVGNSLYVALFSGAGKGPGVARVNASTGKWTYFAAGYKAPVVAVGANNGAIYSGDLTGTIYKLS